MSEQSIAFEKLNARIQRLLQGPETTVTWDFHLPDPDSPESKPRQIDVLIEKDGRRIGVECRKRKGTQDVMWIEELIGRRQSLGLDALIAVAFDGFTQPAQKKAERYGILLYDFRALTDEEIASWTNAAIVETVFVRFEPLIISAVMRESHAEMLLQEPSFLYHGLDGFGAVMDMVRDDAAAHPGTHRAKVLSINGFELDRLPLVLLTAGYVGHIVPLQSKCTAVHAVDRPGTPTLLREITVQRFSHTVSEIIRNDDNVHLVLDVGGLNPPFDSILHEMKLRFEDAPAFTTYELTGVRNIQTRGKWTQLHVYKMPENDPTLTI